MVLVIKKIITYIITIIITFATGIYDRFDEKIQSSEQYEKLWSAVNLGNEQALIEAINEGADINKFEYHSQGTVSPVIWGVCHNQNEKRFRKTLLSYDIDPDFVDVSGATVFYESIDSGYEAFDKLLTSKPNVNVTDKQGRNAIDCYILSNTYESYRDRLEKLIDKGAIVTKDNIEHIIKKIDYCEGFETRKIPCINVLKTLVDNYNGDDVDKNILAAYSGTFNNKNKCKKDVVLYGIAGYCNKDILAENLKEDSDLNLLFRIAIMAGNMGNAKFLYEKGATVKDETDSYYCYKNALNFAVEYGNYEMAKYLIPLYTGAIDKCVVIAAQENNVDIMKLLLDNGANINNKEAFQQAIIYDNFDIIKCFVERGFNVNGYDALNTNPWYVEAFLYCDLDTVKYIHKYSNKLNADELQEAMIESVKCGNLELLQYLKELGADFSIDEVNPSNGSRADSQLIVATRNGYFDVVKFLVENGSTANNYSADELEYLKEDAKVSDDIYNYLTSNGII